MKCMGMLKFFLVTVIKMGKTLMPIPPTMSGNFYDKSFFPFPILSIYLIELIVSECFAPSIAFVLFQPFTHMATHAEGRG